MHDDPLVLLVEDDALARQGYAEFLEIGGYRVIQADSTESALPQAVQHPPDAVVTDISLPGRDGFALAVALRGREELRHIPIVAITAYWETDAHDRARVSGITAIISKPCQPEHLLAELDRVLAERPLPRRAQASKRSGPDPAALPEAETHS